MVRDFLLLPVEIYPKQSKCVVRVVLLLPRRAHPPPTPKGLMPRHSGERQAPRTISSAVVTPAASNQVLQSGIENLAVHAAAVLDPVVGESGVFNAAQVGYLGCGLLDDAARVPTRV